MVVVGGGVPPATAGLVDDLLDHGPPAELVVWDERDVDERWRGGPGVFEVRRLGLAESLGRWAGPAASDRATTALVRAHLARRRNRAIVLVGRRSLGILPWLGAHHGPIAWVPTSDDVEALAAEGGPRRRAEGGVDLVAVIEPLVLREDVLGSVSEPHWRWLPGWRPVRPRPVSPRQVVAVGPPDRDHGIDVVGRALADRADELRRRGGGVRWLAPQGASIAAAEADDLERAGVADLIEVRPVPLTEATADRSEVVGASALLLAGRVDDTDPADPIAWRAHAAGAVVLATDRHRAPAGLAQRWRTHPFGDARSLAAALVDAVENPMPPPGPFGLDGLAAAAADAAAVDAARAGATR